MFLLLCFVGGECIQYNIRNNCPTTIWPATQTSKYPEPSTSGFELPPGASQIVEGDQRWVGRMWARTRCSNKRGYFSCRTGDCGGGSIACNGAAPDPPATTVDFSIGIRPKDSYSISSVHGFNLPVSVTPQGVGCPKLTCYANGACPTGRTFTCPTGRHYKVTFCP